MCLIRAQVFDFSEDLNTTIDATIGMTPSQRAVYEENTR